MAISYFLFFESLKSFLDRQAQIASEDDSETLALAHEYYRNHEALIDVVRDIKRELAPNRIINANDGRAFSEELVESRDVRCGIGLNSSLYLSVPSLLQ